MHIKILQESDQISAHIDVFVSWVVTVRGEGYTFNYNDSHIDKCWWIFAMT